MKTLAVTLLATILMANASFAVPNVKASGLAPDSPKHVTMQPVDTDASDAGKESALSPGLQKMVEISEILSQGAALTLEHMIQIAQILTKYAK